MHDKSEILISQEIAEDTDVEPEIRPKSLKNFIGQDRIKTNLAVFIQAAKDRNEALDHIVLYGPPGLGKTTLSQIVAHEIGGQLHKTSGPMLTKPGDLASILTNMTEKDILFIDEVHRLLPTIEEVLYPAMEDYKIDIIVGEGPAARTIVLDLAKFTLVAATTRMGLLSGPLRDRFGIPLRFEFYQSNDLLKIINRANKILDITMKDEVALEIAIRSRGTPRITLRLLKRVRDFVSVFKIKEITKEIVHDILEKLEIDKFGLDGADRRYLRFIAESYQGEPVGIETISAALSEDKSTIEESVEPYLIQEGFVHKTTRGRIITEKTYQALNINYDIEDQKKLI